MMTKIKNFFHYDAWTLLLDILAVNLAYFGALVIRFYIAFRFSPQLGSYMEMFIEFTKFYTVIAIVVFFLFKLYGAVWIYAGLNDMNRIIGASVVTAVIHIVGTLLFIGRMPISYYIIGAFLQFFFVCIIRFGYRFIRMERDKIEKRKQGIIPALVVGSGDYARKVIHHLEDNTPFRAVVIAGSNSGRNMDGIPVISLDEVTAQIKAKDIQAVFIADDSLTNKQRVEIKKAAGQIEVKDYTGYLSNLSGSMPVSSILEVVEGPVTLILNGKGRKFESGRDAINTLTQRYEVKRITASAIEIEKDSTDESWINEYKERTGEEISFF